MNRGIDGVVGPPAQLQRPPSRPAAPGDRVNRVVGYAYPWDVIGDPSFSDRVAGLGIRGVAMAASYHGTRAATPLHPRHRVVDAPLAALYRPVRESVWSRRPLRPVSADWPASADPFAQATAALVERGFDVDAWVVLAHSSGVGADRPDLAVRNCFDDIYRYAPCISNAEVRDYAALLAAESVRDVPISGISVESCGQMGLAHNGLHEKTVGAYPPAAEQILSVCCCPPCRTLWAGAGADPDAVIAALRRALVIAQTVQQDPPDIDWLLGPELAGLLLACRAASQDALRRQVLAALHDAAPRARVTLHGQADPWATGPSPAVTGDAAAEVDAILVPAWQQARASYAAVAGVRAVAPPQVGVGAYVTVLPPADPSTVGGHAAALVDSGADELHLYHLGLANQSQLDVLGRLIDANS